MKVYLLTGFKEKNVSNTYILCGTVVLENNWYTIMRCYRYYFCQLKKSTSNSLTSYSRIKTSRDRNNYTRTKNSDPDKSKSQRVYQYILGGNTLFVAQQFWSRRIQSINRDACGNYFQLRLSYSFFVSYDLLLETVNKSTKLLATTKSIA